MTAYTPRAGDLVRDADGELWFVYASDTHPANLYVIGAVYAHGSAGQPIAEVARNWGPLRLEYRPA